MKIRDVMTPDIDVVARDDTLTTALQLMADLDCEALPVSDNNRLAGVITGRDIGMRVVAEGCDPKQVTVGQAMTTDALYCFENEPVDSVAQKMSGWWVRRLPVVTWDKRLVGVVSLADMASPKTAPEVTGTGRGPAGPCPEPIGLCGRPGRFARRRLRFSCPSSGRTQRASGRRL
jgi:CBS domain-containing protein